jgi:hypothetical protein
MINYLTRKIVVVVMLYNHIRKALGSNLDWDIVTEDFCGLPHCLQGNVDYATTASFQFIYHPNFTLYSLDTDSILKYE